MPPCRATRFSSGPWPASAWPTPRTWRFRVFRDFLSEGKEPPYYALSGASVVVTVKGQDTQPAFARLVLRHPDLTVDELLVLQHFTRHREVSARQAAEIASAPSPAPAKPSLASPAANASPNPAARLAKAAITASPRMLTPTLAMPWPTMWTAG